MPRPETTRAQSARIQLSDYPSHHRPRRPCYAQRNSMPQQHSDYSSLRAPPTPCPRDIDAFTFLPQYLPEWHMPDALWDALPDYMRKHLAALQHAGAAALTSFQRIEELRKELDGKVEEDNELDESEPIGTPSLTSLPSLPVSGAQSPHESIIVPCTPVSPLDLGQGLAILPHDDSKLVVTEGIHLRPYLPARPKSHNHFTLPASNTRMAQYRAEVSTLRAETVVRLRHALRKVESDWHAILYQHQAEPAKDALHIEAWELLIAEFSAWLLQKKAAVVHLDSRAKGLPSVGALGWA